MPELPEVEIIRIGLNRLLAGLKIKDVTHDWPKSFPNAEEDVKQFLLGAKIVLVERRGKALLIELNTKYTLAIHLKMTGQLVFVSKNLEDRRLKIEDSKTPIIPSSKFHLPNSKDEVRFGAGHPTNSLVGNLPDKSTRVTFVFEDGSKLFFNDQRKFGWVRLIPTAEVPNIGFFKKIGPEPLAADFTAKDFIERIKKRANSNIKAVLLDQTVIAGVGNIYADESLWGAKIHPSTTAKNISDQKLAQLFKELQYVLNLSIEKGGSTDRNYVNHEGRKGSYLSFARVFRREGKECPRCGTIIEKTRVAGRGTHLCPKCQRLESLSSKSKTSGTELRR